MDTYTDHKLTDAQCQRLAAMYNNRPHRHGMALIALINKRLVTETWVAGSKFTYTLTSAGRRAIEDARREGY